ncbi:MAG TPA: outer membrane beta-barrel protein [Hanamia sp.]
MKKFKIILAAFGMICMSQSVSAQKNTFSLDLNYNYSMPLGGFKSDIISNNSPRGFMVGLMYSISDNLSVGLGFGFQDYYQKYPRALYPLGKSQEVSAVLTNSVQTTPILLQAKYYPLSATYLKPYISLGAGANIIAFNQYLGEFGSSATNVEFRAQGGLGLMIPFKKYSSSGINVGAIYDYSPYNKNGYHDLNNVNFQAGVIINLK